MSAGNGRPLGHACWCSYDSHMLQLAVAKPCSHLRHTTWLQVLVSDPKELDKIREREFDITKERIQKILNAGANVILTTKGIDDMSLKYFVEAGAIACRRVPKEDLRSVSCHKAIIRSCVWKSTL